VQSSRRAHKTRRQDGRRHTAFCAVGLLLTCAFAHRGSYNHSVTHPPAVSRHIAGVALGLDGALVLGLAIVIGVMAGSGLNTTSDQPGSAGAYGIPEVEGHAGAR